MEKQIIDFGKYAKKLNMTPKQLLRFMLKQNKNVDYQNIGSNGFKNKSQVDDWWKKQTEATIIKVYNEYYGLEELLKNEEKQGGIKMKTKKEIMEYLGIWEEYENNEINQKAIKEANYIEQKYFNELNTEKYAYAFYGDMSRFYDDKLEEVNIVEDLECITVFEIKPKIKIKK